jgi:hypothetical protein
MARRRRTRCPAWAESGERLDVRRRMWRAGARYGACETRLATDRRWACHVGRGGGLRRRVRYVDGPCVGPIAGWRVAHRRGVLSLDTRRRPRYAYQHTGGACWHRPLVVPDGDSARSGNDVGAGAGAAMSCRWSGTRDHRVGIAGFGAGGCRRSYSGDADDDGCHCLRNLPRRRHAAWFAEWGSIASGLDADAGGCWGVVDRGSLEPFPFQVAIGFRHLAQAGA